ncbi:MAG: polysaccharide deacetylase family protein [Actinomycetota bacterium]|nr:polysaccharide deacetylase family protein [Actinomycetota bacterium]
MALTFDAEHPDRSGCAPGNVDRILDALRDASVTATFFVQGRWAEAAPDSAKRIVEDGHLVGNHSFYHARMPLLSGEGLRTDVTDAQKAIISILGVDPRPWFRCPFGAGSDDPRVLGTLEELGYRNAHWGIVLEDWEPWRDGAAIAHDALDEIRAATEPPVVLLHTWPDGTVDAVPRILSSLLEAEVKLVRIDELEHVP